MRARQDLNKNSFESKYRSLGYARKGGAIFVQWLLFVVVVMIRSSLGSIHD
jgi:hypothetical protein